MATQSKTNFPARAAQLGALGIALCIPVAHAAEDWEWTVTPYLWATSVSTDLRTSTPPDGGVSTDTNFESIVDKLDGAFLMHAEAQGEKFGLLADFIYLGLGDENDHTRFHSESDLDARVADFAAVWSPAPGKQQGFEAFAGLRYIDVDFSADLDPFDPAFATTRFRANDSFNDFLIGARYGWAMSDRWGLSLRGDTSFGDTEGTWNASGVITYRKGNGSWLFGYRHMEVKFAPLGSEVTLVLSGPMFGYAFRL